MNSSTHQNKVPPKKALEGLKVADFSWATTGPLATRLLADHGATVVKIESTKKIDILRTGGPYAEDIPGIERSGNFAQFNANKYSISLDLSKPKGIEVAKKLVAWSDVVVENFRAGAMNKMGLSYSVLEKIRPGIIMISNSMQGQTGPHASQVGYGIMLQALAGITNLVGWPDREPVGVSIPYTDFVSPFYILVALLGCLEHRRRTGRGQYVDLSAFEGGATFFSTAFLDYSTNGRTAERNGNADDNAAPHGVYQCQGDDRWVAISVFTKEQWKGFCRVLGNSCQWTKSLEFTTLKLRKENEEGLNRLIEEWTSTQEAADIMRQMQAVGVPCGTVKDARDLYEDPQLKLRGYFNELDHPDVGHTTYYSPTFLLSKTKAELKTPAPCLGQHTEYVCSQFLGMSDEEFIEVLASGAFE
ncbi:CaiB/BaiF CoA transferase family protein [Chloroflexota bacterium]